MDVKEDPDDLDTVGFMVGEAARLLRKRFDDYARTHGVTRSQWLVLVALLRQEPVSQVRLADYLEVEPMSLCRMADRLQTAGLVERQPDPDDRRINLLCLTPKARDLLGQLRRYGKRVMNYATCDLSPREHEDFIGHLRNFAARLQSPELDQLLADAIAEHSEFAQ